MQSIILSLVTLAAVLHPGGPPPEPASFSKLPRLEVVVVSSEGEPLPGTTLKLCLMAEGPQAGSGATAERACLSAAADTRGEAVFDEIPAGEYRLVGDLPGFANTMVFPLSIGAADPIAPDRVVLLLNPVCWDC